MFASQTRDLSHIELERSDNISSSSKARTYRVGKADISTEEKREQEYKEKAPYILALFLLVYRRAERGRACLCRFAAQKHRRK
jgi:hypothetical protein